MMPTIKHNMITAKLEAANSKSVPRIHVYKDRVCIAECPEWNPRPHVYCRAAKLCDYNGCPLMPKDKSQ